MWCMIESLHSFVDGLSAAYTRPSFTTASQFLLGWIMCLGKHTLWRAAHSAQPHVTPNRSQRHGLDGYYNFFERSAWTPSGLAYQVAVLILTRLQFLGRITLLVDDTLAHKRGKSVWGMSSAVVTHSVRTNQSTSRSERSVPNMRPGAAASRASPSTSAVIVPYARTRRRSVASGRNG